MLKQKIWIHTVHIHMFFIPILSSMAWLCEKCVNGNSNRIHFTLFFLSNFFCSSMLPERKLHFYGFLDCSMRFIQSTFGLWEEWETQWYIEIRKQNSRKWIAFSCSLKFKKCMHCMHRNSRKTNKHRNRHVIFPPFFTAFLFLCKRICRIQHLWWVCKWIHLSKFTEHRHKTLQYEFQWKCLEEAGKKSVSFDDWLVMQFVCDSMAE